MTKVFFINSLCGGGAERVVLNLCQGFLDTHVTVHLILVYRSDVYEVPKGVHLHYLFEKRPKSNVEKLFLLLRASKKLKKVVSKISKKSVIDLFTSHLQLSNYIAWIANISNHYGVIHSNYSNKYGTFSKVLVSLILKNKKLVAVSEGVKDDLVRNFGLDFDDVKRIYNPFDIKRIKEKAEVEGHYDRKYIIHVGRLVKLKRQDLLIEAYCQANLKAKYDLLLLGEGEDRGELEANIKKLGLEDNVKLLGWQANPYEWIKNASLVVLCSDYEGLPTVLIESLICGTPTVSTNCDSGPSEILLGDLSEYLVPTGDAKSLSQKMELALKNYPAIKDIYYEKFDVLEVVKQYKLLSRGEI